MNIPDFLVAVIAASIIYLILIRIDEANVRAQCREPSSTASRMALFFCILVVSVFVVHFGKGIIGFKPAIGGGIGGGCDIDQGPSSALLEKVAGGFDLTKIPEDVQVGLPPF
jgi:hypothetical protein